MPLPTPHKKETENDFIGRCVPLVIDLEGLDKNDEKERKQAIAICYAQWRKAKGGKAMEIEDMVGLSFDVDGEEVPFEELVEVFKARADVTGEGAREKVKEAQKARSKRYGIAVLDVGNVTKPAQWAALSDSEFGDPVNYRYPIHDATHARNARARFAQEDMTYNGRDVVRKRIEKAAKKFKIGEFREEEGGKALSLDEQARQVRDAWRSEFVKPGVPGEVSGSYWPKEVFDDQVIVETPQGLYAYPYTVGEDGEVEFGEPVKVEVQYRPVGEKAWFDGSADEDTVIAFGGEVKALGEGRVGGHLVRWGSKSEKDLTEQWFTTKTFLGPNDGNGTDAMVHHGIPLKPELKALAERLLQPLKTKRDQVGVWAETVLDLADEYEKMIYDMVQAGKLYWSSGSTKRVIRVEPTGEITRWPIVEGSLTPIPAEFRGTQVMPLKSYLKAIGMGEAPKGGGGSGDPRLEAAEAIARSQLLLTEIEQET